MTLQEEAEKICAEEAARLDDPMECSSECHENGPPWHLSECPANEIRRLRAMALSAVLAGMRMVLQGTPHLREVTHDGINFLYYQHQLQNHDKDECARLGGACRLREVAE